MTVCEKEHFKEISRRLTLEHAEVRQENQKLRSERDYWKNRALSLDAVVELLEAEMYVKE
ncbi:MAG: hypothetical protein IJY94_02425 [Clostridia bacterium]|nr:hypothetical protein [Clostridia bacterium]